MEMRIDNSNESERADEWLDGMRDSEILRKMLSAPRVEVTELSAEESFTKKHYPNEPNHRLYQNRLMAKGITTEDRQRLTVIRLHDSAQAKVGDECVCCGCGEKFIKKSYQQRYCKEKIRGKSSCKDFINNWINPARLKRTLEWLAEDL